MSESIKIKEVEKLDCFYFQHTKQIPNGYDWKEIPEATPENMVVLMDKINVLIDCVNALLDLNNELKSDENLKILIKWK